MARLSLAVLGSVSVTLDGQPVASFTYHKARALLVYLAVEASRAHTRDMLVGLLWPDLPNAAARTNLRQALADLRQAIGDADATPSFLHIRRDTIQFNPGSDYMLDASVFSALLTTCTTHPHRCLERCRSCMTRMAEAVARYQGDFLTGFDTIDSAPFEEWQMRQRERLHQQALDALVLLTDYHERRDEHEQARAYAQRQIMLDPWREEAHRQLMRLLARAGQRSAALVQYEACRQTLARDLGVAPAAETTQLYNGIRDAVTINQQQRAIPYSAIRSVPAPATALVGREQDLAALGDLVENPACRLITISGPGGIGKTRLAFAIAVDQADTFADGVACVLLAAITSAAFIAPAILSALGVAAQPECEPLAQLLGVLRGKELLLVLDNLEHLLVLQGNQGEQTSTLLLEILHTAPRVTLLVTSRERLQLPGEWLYDLVGLRYPADDAANDIQHYSAGQLFLQCAQHVRPQFALTGSDAQAVVRICKLVEGMPLAIELAAAGLRGRSVHAIADALAASVAALDTGFRAIAVRHRSVVATFEHSWRLLTEQEQQTFMQLSVFRGGFEQDAAAHVTLASSQTLAALVDKSLLRWDGATRYDLHELVRQYADEKLELHGNAGETRKRHAQFYLELAEAAEPKLRSGQRDSWLARLEDEYPNLRAALAWSLTAPEGGEIGLRLVGGLLWFWIYRNHMLEGRTWAEAAITTGSSTGPRVWANALYCAGMLAWLYDDFHVAHDRLMQSIQHWREADDQRGLAFALSIAGLNLRSRSDEAGYDFCAESVAILRKLHDPWSLAHGLYFFGNAVSFYHGLAASRPIYEESLALWRTLDDPWGMALPLMRLGVVACMHGEYGQAQTLLEESLSIRRQVNHKHMIAYSLTGLADVTLAQRDYRQSLVHLSEALMLYREIGMRATAAEILERCALAAAGLQHLELAVQLWGAARVNDEPAAQSGASGGYVGNVLDLAAVRVQLDPVVFAQLWAKGQSLDLDQLIDAVLELPSALPADGRVAANG